MVILTKGDNGELVFRPRLETNLSATVVPRVWHGFTPALIEESGKRPP